MEALEIEKGKSHIIVEIIQYIPNAVLSKTIIKKTTGNITTSSFDTGEEFAEKTSPFDYVVKSETAFVRLQKAITTVFKYQKIEKELKWYMDRM